MVYNQPSLAEAVFDMKKISLSLPQTVAAVFLYAAALTAALFLIQPRTGISVWQAVLETRGLVFLLNAAPALLLNLFVYFLSGNLVVSCFASGAPLALLSVVNRYMIAYRWAPLGPFDLLLGMEFLGVAKSIRPAVYVTAAIGAALFAAVFVFALIFVKNAKPNPLYRAGLAFAVAAAALILNKAVYANQTIFDRLPNNGSAYSETDVYQSRGHTYSFIHDFNVNRLVRPEYYGAHRGRIEAAISAPRDNANPTARPPNLIMILSEAFSELPLSPQIDFKGHADPLENYKRVKGESLSGFLVVPHFGGGTSNTEFDVLTGINSRGVRGVPYCFTLITRRFPSVAWVLRDAGYRTLAMHPGAGWFYGRQNVYPLLGFETFLDEKAFWPAEWKGMYISERSTFDAIFSEYEKAAAESPDTPLFIKGITIQNHGPYVGKYGRVEKNFNSSLELSSEDSEALSQYFHGLADCDAELLRLVEFIESRDEPILLAYYGDHLPSFPYGLLQRIVPEGDSDPQARFFRLPFIVYANATARESVDLSKIELPEDGAVSAFYFGAMLLDLLGYGEDDPFFSFLNGLRASYPVALEKTFAGRDGIFYEFESVRDESLAMYNSWAYGRITGAF